MVLARSLRPALVLLTALTITGPALSQGGDYEKVRSASGNAAPPPRPVTSACRPSDIEGSWYRADGTAMRISAPGADDARESAFTVPPRAWPRGQSRYRSITYIDGCSFSAVCVDARRQPDDSFVLTSAACILTLDPRASTLSQGDGYSFSRTASTTAEANARRDAEAELKAQDRASEALNAEVNAANAAADARDVARKAEFERRQAEYEAKKKADAEAYARAVADYEARKAAVERQRQADLAAWQAQVEACKAGDKTACAPK
jgi:hypothetical protein